MPGASAGSRASVTLRGAGSRAVSWSRLPSVSESGAGSQAVNRAEGDALQQRPPVGMIGDVRLRVLLGVADERRWPRPTDCGDPTSSLVETSRHRAGEQSRSVHRERRPAPLRRRPSSSLPILGPRANSCRVSPQARGWRLAAGRPLAVGHQRQVGQRGGSAGGWAPTISSSNAQKMLCEDTRRSAKRRLQSARAQRLRAPSHPMAQGPWSRPGSVPAALARETLRALVGEVGRAGSAFAVGL